jgi:hypothetical protein
MARTFAIRINGEVAERFAEYMAQNNHVSPTEALREILAVYFASTPVDGVAFAARETALAQTKHWALTRMTQTFQELHREAKEAVAVLESQGYGR